MKDTKEKLLQTATKMFAKHGIDGVSTRDLVKSRALTFVQLTIILVLNRSCMKQ